MDDEHVFVLVKAVAAVFAVDFVTAVVGAVAVEGIMSLPMDADGVHESCEIVRIALQFSESFRAFGRTLVHGGVVIAVVDDDKVVFVRLDEFERLCVDFVDGIVDEVIEFAFEEDLRNAAVAFRNDRALLSGTDGGIKEGIGLQDRLRILADEPFSIKS